MVSIDLGRRAHPEPTTDCSTLPDIAVSNRRLRRALHNQLRDDGGSNLPYLGKSSRSERILQESSAEGAKWSEWSVPLWPDGAYFGAGAGLVDIDRKFRLSRLSQGEEC
jgi:hypothetical protein